MKFKVGICLFGLLSLFSCSSMEKNEEVMRQPNQVVDIGGRTNIISSMSIDDYQVIQAKSCKGELKVTPRKEICGKPSIKGLKLNEVREFRSAALSKDVWNHKIVFTGDLLIDNKSVGGELTAEVITFVNQAISEGKGICKTIDISKIIGDRCVDGLQTNQFRIQE